MQILRKKFIVFFILVAMLSLIPSASQALLTSGQILGDTTSAYAYHSGNLVNDRGTVYFICGTNKTPFTNWQAFIGLGYSAGQITNGSLSNYTSTPNYLITSANTVHPLCSWLLNKGTVYYSSSDGLIGVPNSQIFLNNGGDWKLLVNANVYDLKKIVSSQLLTNNDSRVKTTPSGPSALGRCEYPAPPIGYHYEGGQPYPTCGAVLANDAPVATSTSVSIVQFAPASAPIGTTVIITGSGFTSMGNKIQFGSTGSENNPNYSLNSADGKTLTFTVPSSNYYACQNSTPACYPPNVVTQPGNYTVSVINSNGTSNGLTFSVTGEHQ